MGVWVADFTLIDTQIKVSVGLNRLTGVLIRSGTGNKGIERRRRRSSVILKLSDLLNSVSLEGIELFGCQVPVVVFITKFHFLGEKARTPLSSIVDYGVSGETDVFVVHANFEMNFRGGRVRNELSSLGFFFVFVFFLLNTIFFPKLPTLFYVCSSILKVILFSSNF